MMKFEQFASGSTGNLYRLSFGGASLLIECGLPIREIRRHLNFELSGISGCLISHSHGDHCLAVKDIMKAGIDCYMTQGTAEALCLSGHRLKTIKAGLQFQIGPFTVMPFATEHDAAEPVGFLIQSGKDKFLYATDTFYIRYKFSGLTKIAIEVNYSLAILQANLAAGIVPMALKNRILRSHFSLDNVKEFFKANDLSAVKEIYLIHLSSQNSDEQLFKTEIERLTGKPVYV
jgi:phosphoribosyl 1,2-cyclic phosphodiesterase